MERGDLNPRPRRFDSATVQGPSPRAASRFPCRRRSDPGPDVPRNASAGSLVTLAVTGGETLSFRLVDASW